MKATKIILLFIATLSLVTSCDIDWTGGAIGVIKDGDDKKDPTIITNVKQELTFSYTNPAGINLKYKIEDTQLEVGDMLRIQIDSENEIKPYVTLSISGDEVVNTSELPVDYESIMNEAKEYNLVFTVYDNNKSYQFNSMTRVTVKEHNSLSSN